MRTGSRVTHIAIAICALGLSAMAPLNAQGPSAAGADHRAADSLYAAHDYASALAEYEKLVRQDSTNATYWFQLGMSAANIARYDRGAVAFARSTALRPNMVAMYDAGAMHARLGHADSAYAWLTRAVQGGFSDEHTLRTDDDLASIRGDSRFEPLVYAATHAATPCADVPERRRFDFWVGYWTVTTAGGTPTGKSVIQSISGGCAVLENWTNLRGGEGKSLNSYNPLTKTWEQFWVDQAGSVTEYREGQWHDRSVTFYTRSADAPAGTPLQRLTFTPVNDSTVRQHGEQSTDAGMTWTTTYDFYYHRRR